MGKRGPQPKPSALKKMQGTYRPDRVAANELAPTLGLPEPPDWLDVGALEEWRRIVPELDKAGVLTLVDGAALEGYCSNFAIAVRYQREADRAPFTVNRFGEDIVNPAASAARKHWALARAFSQEFGLTPASRTRVSVPEKPKDDPAAKFLFGDKQPTQPEAPPGGKH